MARKTAKQLADEIEVLRAEFIELDTDDADDDDVARSEEIVEEIKTLKTAYDAALVKDKEREAVRSLALAGKTESGDGANITRSRGPEVMRRVDPFAILRGGTFGMNETEIRRSLIDSNLKALEGRELAGDNQAHVERVIKRHASDFLWAQNMLARSRPEYETAWAKLMMGRPEMLDEIERTAMSVGTSANGGYLLPTHLDPTLIITNDGTSNVIRQISRVVTLTEGKTWYGVSTAGVTASFDAELAEVSDDTPTFSQPSIPVYKAQSLVQASIEAFQDIASLSSDVMMLFADARDRLEGSAHATGSGSSQPTGIFTALDANTNVEITSTTAATIGEVDLHSVYRQVPVRWRGRSTWLTAPTYALAVKRLGTAVSSSYSGDLTQPVSERWIGRPVVESDDAPTTQTTTALDNEIILGDFSNFVIVDKPGSMSVEFIPHMFNTSNNLPDGRRAWYAFWRTGSDSVNDLGFRLLQDKTSA